MKKNDELQSRRKFFKNAAKSVLPFLGAIVLAQTPTIIKAKEKDPQWCRFGCAGYCAGQCYGSCVGGCYTACTGCVGFCKVQCIGCTGSCYGTCVSTCAIQCALSE